MLFLANIVLLLGTLLFLFNYLRRGSFSSRAWWFLLVCLLAVGTGITARHPGIVLIGLVPLLWFLGELLFFFIQIRLVVPQIKVERIFSDSSGPVRLLWSDQSYTVTVVASLPESKLGLFGELLFPVMIPFVKITDLYPKSLPNQRENNQHRSVEGSLTWGSELTIDYPLQCGRLGVLRFEGVQIELADYQGFFYHRTFVGAPFLIRVFPRLGRYNNSIRDRKRQNELPPPGQQRLLQPGSGSELLDLRDYLPGDPPRTIAWKVSARKDRLITKEYESDVPIRCTLILDSSKSVRIPTRNGTPLQHLVEIATGIIRSNSNRRDLTGLIPFTETTSTSIRPDRNSSHVHLLIKNLVDLASLKPATHEVNPDQLLPQAYAFAQEIHGEQLSGACNRMPWWLEWVDGFPGHWRHRVGFLRSFYRHKFELLWFALISMPLFFLFCNILAGYFLPEESRVRLISLSATATFLFGSVSSVLFLLSTLISRTQRRLGRMRKRLSALLSVRHNLDPGGLALFLEDDAAFSLAMQQFLGDHQIPHDFPLYDPQGNYLFLAPEKIAIVTRALIQAVGRCKDNELFVLLADLVELEDQLQPLLQAVRMTLSRHHQFILVCSWPPDFPLHPAESKLASIPEPLSPDYHSKLLIASQARYQAAFHRVRKRFQSLGVTVVVAGDGDPLPVILERIDRLRKSQILR